ncbi:MAG: aminoacyl-tRNA hydrolase [Clostridia bacterium]|nr:aminoacyl-tRNA hydrolase [Clostridia bacterium]
MYIIVGLGNPGDKYAHTHHNAGFDTLTLLADRLGVSLNKMKCKAKLGEGHIGGERVVLAQPQTFMNLSGESVVELMNWYKADLDHLLVVYDDIDLDPGRVRFRAKGSAGTHNGMRSIIYLLGRDDFPRVRVGVGRAPQGWDLVDWVLAGYRTPEERRMAYDSFLDACDVIEEYVKRGAEAANRLANEKCKKFDPPEKAAKGGKRSKYDFSGVAKAISARVEEKYVAGAVCAVAVDGRMAYQCIQGFANIEAGRKMTRDTTFRLASMTKPVTGVAVMILAERGLVELDDPVDKYLPELGQWRVAGGEALRRPVTLRDLMTHSSGLGQETPLCAEAEARLPEDMISLENVVRMYAGVPLDFQPGTRTGYSAMAGMNVLARVVEAVSGMRFASFIATEIFNPLGMGDTAYEPNNHQWNRIAEVYEPGTLEMRPIGRAGHEGFRRPYDCGSAALVGTMPDYLRFALMLANGGELNGARILRPETVKAMATPQLPDDLNGLMEGQNWGLSMRVTTKKTDAQPLPAGCFGWSGAYGTHFWIDPGHNAAVVLMVAGNVGGASSPLSREVERAVTEALEKGKEEA